MKSVIFNLAYMLKLACFFLIVLKINSINFLNKKVIQKNVSNDDNNKNLTRNISFYEEPKILSERPFIKEKINCNILKCFYLTAADKNHVNYMSSTSNFGPALGIYCSYIIS